MHTNSQARTKHCVRTNHATVPTGLGRARRAGLDVATNSEAKCSFYLRLGAEQLHVQAFLCPRSKRLASIQNVIEFGSVRTMLSFRQSQLVATILVAMSIVAFTPRMLHPHVRLSCGSIDGTTFSGPQRFTDDSSRAPDLKAGYEVNGVPLPQYLKLISNDQSVKPVIGFRFTTPSMQPIVRPPKLLPSRAENQDPL